TSKQMNAVKSMIDDLFAPPNSCGGKQPFDTSATPCNQFVGHALKQLYGVRDFENPINAFNGGYGFMTAGQIYDYLKDDAHKPTGHWSAIDGGYAQVFTNAGLPVVGVTSKAGGDAHDHVILAVPGVANRSQRWNGAWVPSVASMWIGK